MKKYYKYFNILIYLIFVLAIFISSVLLYNIKTNEKSRNDVISEFETYEKDNENVYSMTDMQFEKTGVLYIPKINVILPVFNGTEDVILNNGVGIYEGSNKDLPIYMSHSGIFDKILFSKLPSLKKGDKFYVKNKNDEIKEYQIVQEDTIKAEDEEEFIKNYKVPKDKESILLWTCTPITINTHRLTLRGEYIRNIDAKDLPDANRVISIQEIIYIGIIIISLIVITVFFLIDKKII